jgi:hypothetical protein
MLSHPDSEVSPALLARETELNPAAVSRILTALEEALERMVEAWDPIDTRGGRGTVELTLAPDPWTLGLGRVVDGLPLADPAQLWLDCASQGERALEAADAVAQIMSWA